MTKIFSTAALFLCWSLFSLSLQAQSSGDLTPFCRVRNAITNGVVSGAQIKLFRRAVVEVDRMPSILPIEQAAYVSSVLTQQNGACLLSIQAPILRSALPVIYFIEVSADGYAPSCRLFYQPQAGDTLDFELLPNNLSATEWDQYLEQEWTQKVEKGIFGTTAEGIENGPLPTIQNQEAEGAVNKATSSCSYSVPAQVYVNSLKNGNNAAQCGSGGFTGLIPFNELLAGILRAEFSIGQNAPEAMKAHAVASRSYALYNIAHGSSANCGHAYSNDISNYPVYLNAVNATANNVVMYQGAVAKTFYSARCNGNYTQDSWEAVNKPSQNCQQLGFGMVPYCTSRACSGHSNCSSISGEVPCCHVTISTTGNLGYIYGHGVGLCQRGAFRFAQTYGYSWQDIINAYYTSICISGTGSGGGTCATPATPASLSPGYNTAPGAIVTDATPSFSWGGVSGATCYYFSISEYPYGSSNVFHTANVQGTSYTLPSNVALQNGGSYRWRVQAYADGSCAGNCYSASADPAYIQMLGSGGGGGGGSLNCSGADFVNVPCGQLVSITDNTSVYTNNIASYSCRSWDESGKEVVYELSIAQAGDYQFDLDEGSVDLDFFVLDGCNPSNCIGAGSSSEVITLDAGTYYLVIDGYQGDNGPFTMLIECVNNGGAPATTIPCDNAVALSCGTYQGTTAGKANQVQNYANACGSSWLESGPEVVHSINVTTAGLFEATLSNLNGQNLDIFLFSSCNISDCLDKGNNMVSAQVQPGTYYLVVDGRDGDQGSYTLSVSCPSPAPSGILNCAGAIPLTCGTPYSGTTVGQTNNIEFFPCMNWHEGGPERVHQFTINDPGQVSVSLTSASDLDIFLLPSCDPASCIGFGNSSMSQFLSPGTYYVVVDGYGNNGIAGASYSLTFTCQLQTTPNAPTLLAPYHNAVLASATVPFSWEAMTNVTGYDFQVATDFQFNNIFYQNNSLSVTSLTLPNFPNDGTTFFWRVRAVNNGNWSDWSPVFAFVNGSNGSGNSNAFSVQYQETNPGQYISPINTLVKSNGNIIVLFNLELSFPPYTYLGVKAIEIDGNGNTVESKYINGFTHNVTNSILTSNQELVLWNDSEISKYDASFNYSIWSKNGFSAINNIFEINSSQLLLSTSKIYNNCEYKTCKTVLNSINGSIINTECLDLLAGGVTYANGNLYYFGMIQGDEDKIFISKKNLNGIEYWSKKYTIIDTIYGIIDFNVFSSGEIFLRTIGRFDTIIQGSLNHLLKINDNGIIEWSNYSYKIDDIEKTNDKIYINYFWGIHELSLGTGTSVSNSLQLNCGWFCGGGFPGGFPICPWIKATGGGEEGQFIRSFNNGSLLAISSCGSKIQKFSPASQAPCACPSVPYPGTFTPFVVTTSAFTPTSGGAISFTTSSFTSSAQPDNSITLTPCTASAISGAILAQGNNPLPSTDVSLVTSSQTDQYLTDASGTYTFAGLGSNSSATIRPHKTQDAANGVTTLDAALILQHIQNIVPLGSPYKLIAADVNGSGTVTSADISQINSLILGNTSSFPSGKSWTFVPASHTFANPANPFPYPDSLYFATVNANLTGQDFIGIKLGDVDGDAAYRMAPNTTELVIPETSLTTGAILTVPFKVKNFKNQTAMQLGLRIDPNKVSVTGFAPGSSVTGMTAANFGTSKLAQGELKISWYHSLGQVVDLPDSTVLFTLTLKALRPIDDLKEAISLDNTVLGNECYSKQLMRSAFELTASGPTGARVAVDPISTPEYILYPNPNTGDFTVSRGGMAAEACEIIIVNVIGQIVGQLTWPSDQESISVHIPAVAPGIYFVHVKTAQGNAAVRKIMVE